MKEERARNENNDGMNAAIERDRKEERNDNDVKKVVVKGKHVS